MAWCNESDHEEPPITPIAKNTSDDDDHHVTDNMIKLNHQIQTLKCPSCAHNIQLKNQSGFHDELPGLPAGVKFDPNDIEILEHLEAKVMSDSDNVFKLHPLIDDFIPTLQGDNGICYTHPQKLPGVRKDGQIRHFFHMPSKAYTTGTRKRRKVDTSEEGSETRWHKTGKTKPVFANDQIVKGFKKILVLYTNYGKQTKPEKTNWVMHQYHLGSNEEEREGELVLSKVFYQTQPRHSGNSIIREDSYKQIINNNGSCHGNSTMPKNLPIVECCSAPYINYKLDRGSTPQLVSNYVVQGDAKKARLERK